MTQSRNPKLLLVGTEGLLGIAARAFREHGYSVLVMIPKDERDLLEPKGLLDVGCEVFYFTDIRSEEAHDKASDFGPDYMMSVIFESRIPASFCQLARVCALNFHPAQLPDCRTGNAWFWPLRLGAKHSAITIHHLVDRWDAGNIVLSHPFELGPFDTQGIYYERVQRETHSCCLALHELLEKGDLKGIPQPDSPYYPKLRLRDILVDWEQPAESIECLVRACNPHHYAETGFRKLVLHVQQVTHTGVPITKHTHEDGAAVKPGELFVQNSDLFCAASDTFLRIDIVAVPGKVVLSGQRFVQMLSVQPKECFVNIATLERFSAYLDTKL